MVDLRRRTPPSIESIDKQLLQHLESSRHSDAMSEASTGNKSSTASTVVRTKDYDNMPAIPDGRIFLFP